MTTSHDSTTTSAISTTARHAVLVPGFWLGAWAWAGVEPVLRSAGIEPHAVTLPGLDGTPSDTITLDDHVGAVIDLVEQLDGEITLVGHSGGAVVVQLVVDRIAGRIGRVVYVDSGPVVDGIALFPDATTDLPLPTAAAMAAQHLSTDGLDDAALDELRRRAVPHPAGVASATVQLTDAARLAVPVTVICTSLPSAVLLGMIEAGQMPSELPLVADVRYVDLPTGHWPMLSRPEDLGAVIRDEILGTSG